MHRYHTETLRQIAGQIGLPPLPALVKAPGINEALRLTIHYAQAPMRPIDQVATLKAGHAAVSLEVSYLVPNAPSTQGQIPFTLRRYRHLVKRLIELGLDRLDDQPTKTIGGDRWLLERAAVHYHRDLVLAPGSASGPYLRMVEALRHLWPDALQAWVQG